MKNSNPEIPVELQHYLGNETSFLEEETRSTLHTKNCTHVLCKRTQFASYLSVLCKITIGVQRLSYQVLI